MIQCPHCSVAIEAADFRALLANSPEARMHAQAVIKSAAFGSRPMRRIVTQDGARLVVGEVFCEEHRSVGEGEGGHAVI